MIEAAISIGPMVLDPAGFIPVGQINPPDCTSYNSSLAYSAINGMSSNTAAKAVESDVVSQIFEHQLQRPVNFVDFFISDAEITDPSGKKVRKKALFSPDFDKSIQDITNMDERDGQVWEVTNRLSDTVVNSNGESWHLLASPGEVKSDDHRLILIHNRGDGRAREYFMTIRSSRTALEKVVENLSGHNFAGNEDISTVIISREEKKRESPITLRDIFDQFTSVFDDKERKERSSFLQELRKDAYLTEEELEKRNSRAQRLIETQIKEIFTDKPSLEALGLVAQSIPGWAKMIEEAINHTTDELPLTPTVTLRLIRDTPETGLQKLPIQDIKLTKLNQQFAKQVIEPIMPLLLVIISESVKDDFVFDDKIIAHGELNPQSRGFQTRQQENNSNDENIFDFNRNGRRATHYPDQQPLGKVDYIQQHQRQDDDADGCFPTFRKQRLTDANWSIHDLDVLFIRRSPIVAREKSNGMLNFLPMKIKESKGSAGDIYNESRATMIADFQKALEYIADLDWEITSEVINEKEVINLGRQMLGKTFEGVSFLLAVYDDENTRKSVKHILTALIYREIKQAGENKSLQKYSSFKDQLNRLSQDAVSLKKRSGVLKKAVSWLLMLYMPDEYPFNDTFEYATNNILLMIFYLARFIELEKSAERLSNTDRMKQTAFMSRGTKGKKRQKALPLSSIIYFFSCQVIYQYRPLVISRPDMTQYE